jgi:hypothetical protein
MTGLMAALPLAGAARAHAGLCRSTTQADALNFFDQMLTAELRG